MTDRDDLETKIRCAVRGVVYGQMEERIRLAALIIHDDIRKEQDAQVDWRPSGDACLSDIVGDRIRTLRNALGLNRPALAARYNELAAEKSMSENVLTNIESGRTTTAGQRRRLVNVDEVVIFAKALGVTPSLLMDPNSTGAMAVATALKAARGERRDG